ncbi:hypothetical protein CIK05_00110 [Bdellovibrio sp. qaytius]|nr:hypothetical protein CIK05_00110 [Bdellovibrio sp. qaytius]
MKDFLKILFVLIVVVVAFVTGRNYGETSVVESKEYKDSKSQQAENTRSEEELKLMKDKFQSLLDSSDLKKADEVYGKMMTLFLVDLGLRISEQQQKDLDVGKSQLLVCAAQSGHAPAVKTPEAPTPQASIPKNVEEPEAPVKIPKFSQIAPGRFKSTEWTLVNSSSSSEILKNLEKVKLTNIDAFLKDAPETPFADLQKYYGTFRGKVSAVDGSDYGSLVLAIGPMADKANHVEGEVKFYRGGKNESTSSFSSATWGFTPTGYQGNMVSMGGRFLQIYKIEAADKIAGNFYERLPNGTTKLIGSFVLNRTDRL